MILLDTDMMIDLLAGRPETMLEYEREALRLNTASIGGCPALYTGPD